jgi:hypothetical protein
VACGSGSFGGRCASLCRHSPLSPTGDATRRSCCVSAGSRGSDRVEARHLGGAQGHQRVAQGLCLAGHGLDLAFAVLALAGLAALLGSGTAVFSQAVDQPRALMGRRRNGFGGSQLAAQAPLAGSQRRARLVNRARGEAQGHCHAMGAGAHAARQPPAAGNRVLRREPEPTATVFNTGPAAHVRAHLREADQGRALCNPRKGRQVAPRQAIERGAGIAARCVALLVTAGLRGAGLALTLSRAGAEVGLEALSAHGQWLVIAVIQCDGLPEGAQVLGPPGAPQRLGDRVLTRVAVRVTPRGQGEGGRVRQP